jgi:hypothetical protein
MALSASEPSWQGQYMVAPSKTPLVPGVVVLYAQANGSHSGGNAIHLMLFAFSFRSSSHKPDTAVPLCFWMLPGLP